MKIYVRGQIATDALVNVDGIAVHTSSKSFDIGCVLPDIDESEIQAWQNGFLACALYCNNNIPFFVLGFNDMFFACGLNFKDLPLKKLVLLLKSKQKYINLLLIEKNGLVIKATHRIDLKQHQSAYLKKTLVKQLFTRRTTIKHYLKRLPEKMSAEKMFAEGKILWLRQ